MLLLPTATKQQIMQRPDAALPTRGRRRVDPKDALEEDFIQSTVRATKATQAHESVGWVLPRVMPPAASNIKIIENRGTK